MKKQASARIKNKMKILVARSIATMERSLNKGRYSNQVRHKKPNK